MKISPSSVRAKMMRAVLVALPVFGMQVTSAPAQVTQEVLESISTPNTVTTSIGTLEFFDGAPLPKTAETVYDYLDRMRGVDAFLKGMPAASLLMLMKGIESIGADAAHKVVIFDKLMDAKSIYLTANPSTMYVLPNIDLKRDGPTVVEVPPGALGAFNDAYFRYMMDVGVAGPDKGKGGRYLVLPPGYEGSVPDGYVVVKSPSYRVMLFMRWSIAEGLEKATKIVSDKLKVYPLSQAGNPPALALISGSGKSYNTVHANTFKFYEELNEVIQYEPIELLNPEIRGLFAAIGIEKGKPFKPDVRMRAILEDAIKIGNAAARSIVWYPRDQVTLEGVHIYPDRRWVTAFVNKDVFFDGPDNWTMSTDARVTFHYPYTAVTPAMATPRPGTGSDYAMAFVDANNQPLDGSKTYKVNLPNGIPVKNYWSFTVYDSQTRSMLATDQPLPVVNSIENEPKANKDGSIDIYFSAKPPTGMQHNWVQTDPKKSFFIILRMYGPLNPWFDQTWKPSDVELAK